LQEKKYICKNILDFIATLQYLIEKRSVRDADKKVDEDDDASDDGYTLLP
jgi:hypothetical protein